MTADVKKKNCKRCHKDKRFDEFPDSPHSKDGKLGFCKPCWSRKMEIASVSRVKAAKAKKLKINREKDPKGHPAVDKANAALKAVGATQDAFLVRASDKIMICVGEEKALRQAMEWKMKGRAVTVWRQCEFEMVLRIVG